MAKISNPENGTFKPDPIKAIEKAQQVETKRLKPQINGPGHEVTQFGGSKGPRR